MARQLRESSDGEREKLEALVRVRFDALAPIMDERRMRLWAAAEATAIGAGGGALVSRATGISEGRIIAGRRELSELARTPASTPAHRQRVRRPGGGRPRADRANPDLLPALEELVAPATRGDPESPLRWTSKGVRTLAAALRAGGHEVGPTTVASLLHELGYSLQAAKKTVEGKQHHLHVHFHTLAADVVFEKQGGGVRAHDAPPPDKRDLEGLVRRVHERALRWLRRHRYLDDRPADERGYDAAAKEPIDAFAALALAGGTFSARPFEPDRGPDDGRFEKKERRFSASYEGFDVHCAVRVDRDDDEGRERLVRYCARPAFALDRIEPMKDGRIAYRMKTPRRGSTHRVMTPMEFMARIAILVPPPYFPLTRYHGVFAARSSWRPLVTPKPPPGAVVRKKTKTCKPCKQENELRRRDDTPSPEPPPPTSTPSPPTPPITPPASAAAADEPTLITVKHWRRLLDGDLYASSSRLDWAVLLRRTHGIDALACPTCDGRLRPIATITDAAVARKILLHLGRRAEPLPRARARDPTGQESFDFDAA